MICTGCMGCRWYVQAIWASHMICSSLLSLRLLYLTRKLTDPKLVTRSRSISKWEQCSQHQFARVSSQHKSGGFLVDFSGISQGFHKQKMELFVQVIADAIYTWARELLALQESTSKGVTHISTHQTGSSGKFSDSKNGHFSGFFCEFPRVQTSRHKHSNLPT